MRKYIIIRYGANQVNQPGERSRAVGLIDARDMRDAKKIEAKLRARGAYTVRNNQRVGILAYSRAGDATRAQADKIALGEKDHG